MDPETPITREILWNVPFWARAAMYGLFAAAAALFLWGAGRSTRSWLRGRASAGSSGFLAGLRRLLRHGLWQVKIWRSPAAGLSHLALFWGFLVLFAGTCVVAVEDYGAWFLGRERWFFHGPFYLAVSWALEVFGLAFLGGLVLALRRRRADRRFPPPAGRAGTSLLWLLLAIGGSGFLLEGVRIAATAGGLEANGFERWSFAGWALAHLFTALGEEAARRLHLALWLLHMALSMAFIAWIPFSRLRHLLFAPLHLALTKPRPRGSYPSVAVEEVEATGRYGAGRPEDFTWRQLLSYDACTECARCDTVCPARAAGQPLAPMHIVRGIAAAAGGTRALHGEAVRAESLWACTSCRACVEECPVLIDQLEAIVELRRHLVGEGEVRGTPQSALRALAASGNPWGFPQEERLRWAEGLEVPVAGEGPRPEALFWVGCAGSYDRRGQEVSRALVRIFRAAGVRFAVLGTEERCTGDPARRLGDEFTFRELAAANVAALERSGAGVVVTACAHCYNTLRNEYPELGAGFSVVHHTQFVGGLIRSGRLRLGSSGAPRRLVFHDACYLGRHNGEYEAPRELLRALGAELVEVGRSRERGFCCGGGGGRMWMDETPGTRISGVRWRELEGTRPEGVAVACPYCKVMLADAAAERESRVQVADVAELVAAQLEERT